MKLAQMSSTSMTLERPVSCHSRRPGYETRTTTPLLRLTASSYYAETERKSRGKPEGGGVCVYVNEKWCHPNNAVIKRHWCSPHLECLTVSLRPYYLPREFSHIVYNTIYVPNRNVARPAAQELCEIIDNIETSSPDALVLINGDFNYCSLKKTSVKYHQHVTCATRENVTLDMFYSNVKDAYTSNPVAEAW